VIHSLKKHCLLKNKKAIQSLFSEGQWIRSPYYNIVYRYTGETRFLFAARKTIGCAVDRNFAKRYLRESVRQNQDCITPGYHYGFIARHTPKRHSLELYKSQIKKSFHTIP
jgi:ribonuclease P protein component